jgi:two-component system sensor histidine kinase KdpD
MKRRIAGLILALIGGPALTWLPRPPREESITSDVLSYQLLVVIVALVGGIWPALFAAVLSGLTLDFFFIEPFYTVTIDEPLHRLRSSCTSSSHAGELDRRPAHARRARRTSRPPNPNSPTVAGSVLRGRTPSRRSWSAPAKRSP